MSSSSKTVCIIYGVNEGSAMGRKFRAACRAAGFTISHDPRKADIIFAHSGGALLVPSTTSAKLVLLVGVAYWPGRSWLQATKLHLQHEASLYREQSSYLQWSLKWIYRAGYFFKFRSMLRMKLNQNMDAPWNTTSRQVLVRNQRDEYCCPDICEMPFKGPRSFISLPGGHDDCWDNPKAYISLLQSDI